MGMIEVDEGTLRELTSLLGALKDSATAGLAERISNLMGSLGAVAGEIEVGPASAIVETAMDNADGLTTVMQQLGDWQRNGTWKSLTETVSLAAALRDSATPHLAERLSSMAIGLGEIAGEAGPGVAETVSAVEEHGANLAGMIRQVGAWQQDGTWDALVQWMTVVKGVSDSLTPHLVERVVSLASDAVIELRQAMDLGLLDLAMRAAQALPAAADAARTDGSRVTAMGLVRSLKDPEIQSSVKLMMALLRRLPQIVEEAK